MAKTNPASDAALLRKSALFGDLSDEQAAHLASRLRAATYKRNSIIFLKDDPGDALYIIRSGRVKISVESAEGKDLILNIYGAGDVFGEMAVFDGLARSAAATAVENVEALVLTRTAFTEAVERVPGLASNIIALLSRRLRYTTQQTEMLGLFGAYERVAFKLLQLAPAPATVVNISQQELAAMLGLTREWINKILKTFADEGVIEIGWGKITILKRDSLESWQ